ncbi:single-stranded-DNA-specific exonuclease RecJ [Methyloligella sp. 2.7D]|uniref:single-stranded-DNA-specific exonuclease RecJ n=1 Tax=unclassified Methyloligella TaxID=2625955 RepID=UPI00157D899A|nr:single-stranded-DNA-specific exonuclease RecJ [Methyloligella sp. GL2]QKP77566.1 single-stranded-DNA-specific exonuclease RecJ [Methyloligella sp. GL2]
MTALPRASETADEAEPLLGVARSVLGKRWVERLGPEREYLALAVAQQGGVPEILGRVLAARGTEPAMVADFLNPTLRALLPDPSSLQDMDKAASRFADAILAREPMAVFGDYDVDGAASLALVERFLRHHGQSASAYIPDRLTEGYGPSPGAMRGLAEEGASLILTVDCGISSHAAVEAANAAGAEVLVLDHHQAGEELPDAYAVVNPNREDDLSGQGHLAAAGVVFLFLVATLRQLRARGAYKDLAEPDLLSFLDLVGLATVCDVVPLKGVNRAFVTQGLKIMQQRKTPGLRALADVARLEAAPSSYTLGFVFGPRINAGGRTGFSGLGAKLLCTDDDVEARGLADRLEALNTERKAIEDRMLEEAAQLAEMAVAETPDTACLVLGAADWHKGLLGLVASRITERFERPTLVIAWSADGEGTGSARSIPGIDLGRAIRDLVDSEVLTKGGGHAMAAGFSLSQEKLEALHAALNQSFAESYAAAMERRRLSLDGTLSASGATPELLDLLDRAGPYGPGQPKPRFAFAAHRITRLRVVGSGHVRVSLAAPDGSRLEACAFRAAETPLGELLLASQGKPLHFAGSLRLNRWQGRETVELSIEDAAAL